MKIKTEKKCYCFLLLLDDCYSTRKIFLRIIESTFLSGYLQGLEQDAVLPHNFV